MYLYVSIYIAHDFTVHTKQSHFQCKRLREKSVVLRREDDEERKERDGKG